MNPPKKPNANSPLQMLPAERQAQIIEWLNTRSIEDTRKQLLADGFKTSSGALSEFRSWWELRQRLKRNESRVQAWLEDKAKREPSIPTEQLTAYGQEMFTLLAMDQEDSKEFVRVQKLILAREQLKLDLDKFQFDGAKACLKQLPQLKAIGADNSLDEDAKIQAIRLAVFGSAPA
jgi:hypothetical protein